MKTKWLTIPGVILSASLLVPAAASAQTPKPTAEKHLVLVPGPATANANRVNVRAQASFRGEVIMQLNQGDAVTVIEQVSLAKPRTNEPAQWAKIAMPPGQNVWVHNAYIDASNHVVLPPRLNVRAGAGENYSIVGLMERGTPVKVVSRTGDWVQIGAPAGAYAFVAARFLKQEGVAPAVPPIVSIATEKETPEAPPEVAIVTEPGLAAPPDDAPEEPMPGAFPEPIVGDEPPPAEEPPPPRIVTHEGVVRPTQSIQAPTTYEIWDPKTRITINYLYTSSTNLDLSIYKGLRILVTGEEGLDKRWKTPVITIQRIQVLEE